MFASIFGRRPQSSPTTPASTLAKRNAVLDGRIAKSPKSPTKSSRGWWKSADLPELSKQLQEAARVTTPPPVSDQLMGSPMSLDIAEDTPLPNVVHQAIKTEDWDTDIGTGSDAEASDEDEVNLRVRGGGLISDDEDMADDSEGGGDAVGDDDSEGDDSEGDEEVGVEESNEESDNENLDGDSQYDPEDASDLLTDEDAPWAAELGSGSDSSRSGSHEDDDDSRMASESPDPLNIDHTTARRMAGRYFLYPARQAVAPALWQTDSDDQEDGLVPQEDDDEDPTGDWPIEPEELKAYEESKKELPDTDNWLRDEHRLHKLLSLRGMHPLMPAGWRYDFLGVPMYPSLFAPLDSEEKTLIYNLASQFRASRAFRGIFDLQARVTCLRQVGLVEKIAPTIKRELTRFVNSVLDDAGLRRYDMVRNIAIKSVRSEGLDKDVLTKTIKKAFQSHLDKYTKFYGEHPELTPPRLIYGFVIIQHAVLLFTFDGARPKARPRLIADFNLSQGDQWLDASLGVAIPIYLARERLLPIAAKMEPMEEDTDDPDK